MAVMATLLSCCSSCACVMMPVRPPAPASSSSSSASSSSAASSSSCRPSVACWRQQQSWRYGGVGSGQLRRGERRMDEEDDDGVRRLVVGRGMMRRRDMNRMVHSERRVGGVARGMAPDEEKMTRRSPLDFPLVRIFFPSVSLDLVSFGSSLSEKKRFLFVSLVGIWLKKTGG
jgi:hypothetical protein